MNELDNILEASDADPSPLAIVFRFVVTFAVAVVLSEVVADFLPITNAVLLYKAKWVIWFSVMFTYVEYRRFRGPKGLASVLTSAILLAAGVILISTVIDYFWHKLR